MRSLMSMKSNPNSSIRQNTSKSMSFFKNNFTENVLWLNSII